MSLSEIGKTLLFKYRLSITKNGRIGRNEDNNCFQLEKTSAFINNKIVTPGEGIQFLGRCNQSNTGKTFLTSSVSKYRPTGEGESLSCIDSYLESWNLFKIDPFNKPTNPPKVPKYYILLWLIIVVLFLLGYIFK